MIAKMEMSVLAEDLCGRLKEMNGLNIFSIIEENHSSERQSQKSLLDFGYFFF